MKWKPIFFMLLFLTVGSTVAKENNLPITVAVNESITVTLFFPSEIRKVIEPAVNYRFEYEQNGTMGTLMARKGVTSNLTVITKDGSIFSFLLKYDHEVDNFTYMLSADQAIGTMGHSQTTQATKPRVQVTAPSPIKKNKVEQSKITSDSPRKPLSEPLKTPTSGTSTAKLNDSPEPLVAQQSKKGSSLYATDRQEYYQIFSENKYLQQSDFEKEEITINLITLQLNNIIADHDELYFVMELQNNSWSDYKVKSLRFYVKSLEVNSEIQIKEPFIYNLPEIVPEHSVGNFVFVCKNFKLAKGQKVYAVLEEMDGRQRSVMLPFEFKVD